MRQKLFLVLLGIALVVGLIALPPADVVHAGRNGQQLTFFVPAGASKISWLYVHGTYYTGNTETWSKNLNPAVTAYDLTNYWWKNNIDLQWRLTNGVNGYCTINVPETMPTNWISVNLYIDNGRRCYPSR